jgi:hypothetical protein
MSVELLTPKPVAPPRRAASGPSARKSSRRRNLGWLAAAFPFAFAIPFLFTDVLDVNRDLFYGVYAFAVAAFVTAWARDTGLTRRDLLRNWRWGVLLGALGAAATTFIVFRTEDATSRPGGLELGAAIFWRGIVYGATDGVLLSVFPILAVFGAFGFRQGMVQAVFLIESSFIALTSIAAGTILGLILAENIVHDSAKQPSWENLTLVVPWGTFGVVFLAVYAVALAATLAPAIRASRVRPAEALRYQ